MPVRQAGDENNVVGSTGNATAIIGGVVAVMIVFIIAITIVVIIIIILRNYRDRFSPNKR